MLSVPWLIGWALRPYIQISASAAATPSPAPEDRGSSVARAQVKRLSSPSAARPAFPVKPLTPASSTSSLASSPPSSPISKSPYPVTIQPVTAKLGEKQVDPQPVQQVTISKTSATKASGAPPTKSPQIIPKQVQQVQGAPQSPVQQVTGISKTSATKTSGPPPPKSPQIVPKQAQPVQLQGASQDPETKVSKKSIILSSKMSEDWAQQQLEKFKVSFEEADKDKSGFLSFNEVFSVLSKNGFKGSKDEAKKLFAQLDVDNDKKLSRDEFASAMKKLPRMTVKEYVLRKAFKQLDKDGSGTLTRQEIENAAKQEAGLDIPAERIADLLVILSKDTKDNVVDYEEFLRAFGIDQARTVMHQIFKSLDTDKSGFLTRDEIMKAVEGEHELKLRAAKISDLLLAWHKDADKKISYDEFLKVWTDYR